MSFSYMNKLFSYNCYNNYNIINNILEANIFCVNDDLSCLAKINNKLYKIFLKYVPKKKILKQYLKYLVLNKNIKVELINSKKKYFNTYYGIIYDINGNNINKMLLNHYKHYASKYIYEKISCRKSKMQLKYKTNLEVIYEDDEELNKEFHEVLNKDYNEDLDIDKISNKSKNY